MTLKHESYTPRLSFMHKTQKPRSSSNVELAYLQTSGVRDLRTSQVYKSPARRALVQTLVFLFFCCCSIKRSFIETSQEVAGSTIFSILQTLIHSFDILFCFLGFLFLEEKLVLRYPFFSWRDKSKMRFLQLTTLVVAALLGAGMVDARPHLYDHIKVNHFPTLYI